MFQVALDREVGNLLVAGQVQDLAQLGVGDDDALVVGLVQAVGLDVLGQAAGDVGARHLSALGHVQEGAHLRRQLNRLGEARGGAAGVRAAALGLVHGLLHTVVVLGQSFQLGLDILDGRHQRDQQSADLGDGRDRDDGGSRLGALGGGGHRLNGRLSGRGRLGGLLGDRGHRRRSGRRSSRRRGGLSGNGGDRRGGLLRDSHRVTWDTLNWALIFK